MRAAQVHLHPVLGKTPGVEKRKEAEVQGHIDAPERGVSGIQKASSGLD